MAGEPVAFVRALARRFFEDRLTQTAGSLTYTTLLGLVPLLTVALSVSTTLPFFDEMVEGLHRFVLANFLPDAQTAAAIGEQLEAFVQRAGELTAIGLAVLGAAGVMLMLTIDDVLNRIFRVQRPRPLAHRVPLYFAVLVAGPLLIGASLSLTTFVVAGALGVLRLDWLAQASGAVLPFALTCAALALLYGLVPNRPVRAAHAFAGAVLAGLAFELAKRAFAGYVSRFPTYTMVYGAFATLFVFLLWLYLSWVIVLLGATFTAMLPGDRRAAVPREQA